MDRIEYSWDLCPDVIVRGIEMRFFEVWRRFGDWLLSGLTFFCGVSCFVGAANAYAIGGPVWMMIAMIAAGVTLFGALYFRSRKKHV